MAGLLDLFGGGDNSGGMGLYGDVLTPDQRAAITQRGLLGFLGGMQKSGALDYTAPFLSGKVPGGLAAGLAGGAGAMGEAQDAAGLNALRGGLLGLQGQQIRANLGILGQESDIARGLLNGGGMPNTAGPPTKGTGPAAAPVPSPAQTGPLMAHLTQNLGYSPAQAAAVLGNAQLESGLLTQNPGDGGTSDGLFQWHNDRLDGLKNYADSQGKPWTDPIVQLDFMDKELRSTAPEFFQTQNPMQAAQIFQDKFERPARDTGAARGQAAAGILNSFGGAGSSAPAPNFGPVPQPGQSLMNMIGGRPTLAPPGYQPPSPGGVPGGQTLTPAAAAQMNAGQPVGQHLPAMPSNYIFGRGLGAPPATGTQSPGVGAGNGQPFTPGLLAQGAPQAPQAPGPGLLAQGAPSAQPMSSAQPAPPAMPSGGLMPGGAMAPGGINPQAAQALAYLRTARGATVPDFINQAAGFPFIGPKALAQANATNQSQLFYGPQIKQAEQRAAPPVLRQGSVLPQFNPATGKYEVALQNPQLPPGTTLRLGPNGQELAEKVPGAEEAIQGASRAQHAGQYQAEYGGVPGTQLGGAPQAGAAGNNSPIPTPRGTALPPISAQFMPQSPGELEHAIPAWQKKTDEWNAGIAPARQAEMRLSTIAQAFKLTETGAFETHKAELGAMLKGMGIDPGLVMQTKPDAVQEALHDNILTTLPLLKAATPRPSQIEFMSVSQNREHPNLQPSANLRMLSEDIALVRQAQQLPADWNMAQQQGWRNPQSFETAWSQLNPLDKVREQVTNEIGPLKGMGKPTVSEGGIVYGPNGQKIQNRGGQWLDLGTLKPYQPAQ